MELPIQLDSKAQLSEHFTLGEFTISKNHPEVYNIPTHEAIANMARFGSTSPSVQAEIAAKSTFSRCNSPPPKKGDSPTGYHLS